MEHNGTGKLDVLRKREAEIRAKIAAETVKLKRHQWKEFERLKNAVGGAVLAGAAQDAEVALFLKNVLARAAMAESDRKLLLARGL